METLAWITVALLLVVALAAVVATRVSVLEGPVRTTVWGAEALVALVVVADLAQVLTADAADRPGSMVTHVGYSVAAVGLVPLLVVRRPPEDDPEAAVDPASLWVVAIALVAVAVCLWRLLETR